MTPKSASQLCSAGTSQQYCCKDAAAFTGLSRAARRPGKHAPNCVPSRPARDQGGLTCVVDEHIQAVAARRSLYILCQPADLRTRTGSSVSEGPQP